MSLQSKKIVLGVTGGIAAYKAANIIRLLVKKGAEVRVIMTPLAKEFVTPLTLATLSNNPILVDFFDPTNGAWNSHVKIGLWADAYLIAPATANTMGKMSHGIADNLLLTSYLSARCPVFVAPTMDLDMYAHPSTQENIETLRRRGNHIIEPGTGFLASGLEGKGRMAEPEEIVQVLEDFFTKSQDLAGKKIMITAGPTYEKIDPVRFIGNYSSGKMGFALAEECACRGAQVTLVAGPVDLKTSHPAIERIDVESAAEMYEASVKAFATADSAILCAAVADFTPETSADQKIKREKDDLVIRLKPTRDIAAELGKCKTDKQVLVGFALETHNELANAQSKLERKNLDFIVLNSLQEKGAGFRHDTNKICIVEKSGAKTDYELKLKPEVAADIIDKLAGYLK
ncbi:bifunctional phosphopantothenoylcysteine decarboxylase/phosphopantothenate--cysteine ligase CoaBC [Parabacteroides sp. FAFU027]|uniref:bifunctional phosphopantothenoylcysteine decarboxylase/phosphopantothenate--cysteine ligase CoaBC n=1 Tax=Parabacteroides sp. FAFU027 TaxID=2922715 RepID=UPI001FAE8FE5|nr:bifunctional phosphopantothenoylcysteine decarboxylase/phosphopantothenate--cysteine ligase CoaBC [Parabacteroides sp. FAFU027]